MGLADYTKVRRKAALFRTIFTILIVVACWVIFLKLILLSGETKIGKGEAAAAKENWEEVIYQYKRAHNTYNLYLEIFEVLPHSLSIVDISEVKKSLKKARAGKQKFVDHNREVERKNKEYERQKEEVRRAYLERLKRGEIAPDGTPYEISEPEDQPEIDFEVTEETPEAIDLPEKDSGRWLEDIKDFDEPESAPEAVEITIGQAEEEGVVKSKQPAWFNK